MCAFYPKTVAKWGRKVEGQKMAETYPEVRRAPSFSVFQDITTKDF